MSHGAPGQFAYAQVRLQARLGARAISADFERLHAARDLPALLQAARSSPLTRHVERLEAGMGVHDIERRLREEWVASVHEVTRWQPAAWREAIAWLRWLAFLPALQKLARGGRAPAWMRTDPVLAPLVAVEPRQRERALAGTPLAAFALCFGTHGPSAVTSWLAHWRSLWPPDAAAARNLSFVMRVIARTDAELRHAPAGADSAPLLARAKEHLERLLRRNPCSPTAAVAYLALEALTLLALRGAVSTRALCPGQPS